MDLKHDWKTLNEVLFESAIPDVSGRASSLLMVEDHGKIIDGILSNGTFFEDSESELGELQSISKEKLDAYSAKYRVDQAVVIAKKRLDQAIVDAAFMGTNYYQQLSSIREEVIAPLQKLKLRAQTQLVVSRKHFILDFFGGWVGKLLPRKFNVVLFVDQRSSPRLLTGLSGPFSYKAILLTYTKGIIDEFYEPDFSSLHDNRLTNWTLEATEIGQYLASRYILPCYALFMYKDEWEKCRQAQNSLFAWDSLISAIEQGNARIYPENRLTRFLVLAYRVYFFVKRKFFKEKAL